jgi:hypothetical protein
MSEPSEERLVNFLREHQPSPPPASTELERSLFEEIGKEPKLSIISGDKRQKTIPFINWRAGLVACSLLLVASLSWSSYNLPQRDTLEAEIAEIVDQTDPLSLYAIDSDTGLYDVKL